MAKPRTLCGGCDVQKGNDHNCWSLESCQCLHCHLDILNDQSYNHKVGNSEIKGLIAAMLENRIIRNNQEFQEAMAIIDRYRPSLVNEMRQEQAKLLHQVTRP